MKQGQASHSGMGSTKVEPKAHAVSPGAVSRLGEHVGGIAANAQKPLYEGRGLEAPMAKETIHHSGSQGRHK